MILEATDWQWISVLGKTGTRAEGLGFVQKTSDSIFEIFGNTAKSIV